MLDPLLVPSKKRRLYTDLSLTNLSTYQLLKIKKQKTIEDYKAQEAIEIALDLLKNKFEICQAALAAFPPEIILSYIWTLVSKYKDKISTASKRSVCCLYSRFVVTKDIYKIYISNKILLSLQYNLDYCSQDENSWFFYMLYNTTFRHSEIPTFSAINFVNVTIC